DEDEEFKEFIAGNAAGGTLVFGRKTYEMMESFWPTPTAAKQFPEVAKQMNALPKIVFSKTLKKASWNNTRLVKGDLIAEIRKLKKEAGDDLATLMFTRLLHHAPGHVWDAIATPEGLKEWLLCTDVRIDGGIIEMTSGPGRYHSKGKILRWEPPRIFEYEWKVAPAPEMPLGEN